MPNGGELVRPGELNSSDLSCERSPMSLFREWWNEPLTVAEIDEILGVVSPPHLDNPYGF